MSFTSCGPRWFCSRSLGLDFGTSPTCQTMHGSKHSGHCKKLAWLKLATFHRGSPELGDPSLMLITKLGVSRVEETKQLETYCDALYEQWSAPLYGDLDRSGANVRERFAHQGLLQSTVYWRAVVDLVFGYLVGMEEAFVRSYIRPAQERSREGVTDYW